MNKLTAGVCCFALSGFFAWIAASTIQNAVSARAHATTVGAYLMMDDGPPTNLIANLAMVAAILMVIVGLVCIVSGIRARPVQDING